MKVSEIINHMLENHPEFTFVRNPTEEYVQFEKNRLPIIRIYDDYSESICTYRVNFLSWRKDKICQEFNKQLCAYEIDIDYIEDLVKYYDECYSNSLRQQKEYLIDLRKSKIEKDFKGNV